MALPVTQAGLEALAEILGVNLDEATPEQLRMAARFISGATRSTLLGQKSDLTLRERRQAADFALDKAAAAERKSIRLVEKRGEVARLGRRAAGTEARAALRLKEQQQIRKEGRQERVRTARIAEKQGGELRIAAERELREAAKPFAERKPGSGTPYRLARAQALRRGVEPEIVAGIAAAAQSARAEPALRRATVLQRLGVTTGLETPVRLAGRQTTLGALRSPKEFRTGVRAARRAEQKAVRAERLTAKREAAVQRLGLPSGLETPVRVAGKKTTLGALKTGKQFGAGVRAAQESQKFRGFAKKAGITGAISALALPLIMRAFGEKGEDPTGGALPPEMQMQLMQQLAAQQQKAGTVQTGRELINLNRALGAIKSIQQLIGMMGQPVVGGGLV
jgi:hypothetical protein